MLAKIILTLCVRSQTDDEADRDYVGWTGFCEPAAMTDDLTLLQIAMRVGMSCAFTAVAAAGILMIFRISAWLG